MDVETIKRNIDAIKRDLASGGTTEEELKKKYLDFWEQCPTIFTMIQRNDFDETKMKAMLSLYDRVQQGSVTYEKASQDIGKQLFDEYVKPVVDAQK